jgi:pimeloyl-ACP methyl ester carboxylesterase
LRSWRRGRTAAPIEEGYFATINGIEQWITIRGRDPRNPILLFLHGGPGAAQSGTAPLFAPWEESFTIVQWDQPMSGATYAKNIGKDVGPLTVERYTRDGIVVVEHVLKRLGARKLVLMGASWGSELGLIIADRRPDLIAAYVGTAQAVSGTRGLAIWRWRPRERGVTRLRWPTWNASDDLPTPRSTISSFTRRTSISRGRPRWQRWRRWHPCCSLHLHPMRLMCLTACRPSTP